MTPLPASKRHPTPAVAVWVGLRPDLGSVLYPVAGFPEDRFEQQRKLEQENQCRTIDWLPFERLQSFREHIQRTQASACAPQDDEDGARESDMLWVLVAWRDQEAPETLDYECLAVASPVDPRDVRDAFQSWHTYHPAREMMGFFPFAVIERLMAFCQNAALL